MKKIFQIFIFLLLFFNVRAQNDSIHKNQRDIVDVYHSIFNKKSSRDSIEKKFRVSIVPAVGYTLQTGWAGIISANINFKAGKNPEQKVSNINTSFSYSEYKQIIFPLYICLWNKENTFNFISDIKYIKYPSSIYGLGDNSISADENSNTAYSINYSSIKIHESIMFSLKKNFYIGGGYYYDQFWHIAIDDKINPPLSDVIHKNLGSKEVASGIALKVLYDSRINPINPSNGFYANFLYRPSFKFLGSSINWATLQLDIRKYVKFPEHSDNVFAFWGFGWMNIGKNSSPYLFLPSNGWDDQYNTARGYIQGRYRGKNMFYYENEYRFKILNNGLLGGVVFGNVQTYSGDLSGDFKKIILGYGFGLRIKINKYAGTNLGIDYGFGKNNSQGFFVNLGEVF